MHVKQYIHKRVQSNRTDPALNTMEAKALFGCLQSWAEHLYKNKLQLQNKKIHFLMYNAVINTS